MPFTFVPSNNYPGSSGIGTWAAGGAGWQGEGTSNKAAAVLGKPEYALYNPVTGQYVSNLTGQPFNGTDPNSGKVIRSGKAVSQQAAGGPPAPTGDPNKDYAAVNIPKNPALASETDKMLQQFSDTANNSLKDFGQYLTSFKTDLGTARTAADTAANITPTVNALTGAQQSYAQQLRDSQAAYQQALASSAGNQRGVVAQELGNLPQYNAAVDAVTARELAQLGPYMSKYKLGTGTPTGGGSAEQQILASKIADIAAPMELEKIRENQRILAQQALPVEQNIAGQNIAYAGSYLPGIASGQYGSATTLANTVQSLKDKVASMRLQDAVAFMQAAAVPLQVQAQVLGMNVDQLQRIANLYPSAYYQGLNYLPGSPVTPTIGTSLALPAYPSFGGSRAPTMNPYLGGNAPVNATAPRRAATPTGNPLDVSYAVNTAGALGPLSDYAAPGMDVSAAQAPAPDYTDLVQAGMDYRGY